jgi:predicted CXXCH cytochrome family protein
MPSRLGAFCSALVLLVMCADAFGDIRTTMHGQFRSSVQSGSPEERSPEKGGSSEICVFCHTPSGNGVLPQASPKWQQATPLQHAYTIYDDIGRAQFDDKPSVGSQSVACLSCHDAAQAFSVSKLTFDHPFGVPYRGYLKEKGGQQVRAKNKYIDEDNGASVSAKHLVALDEFRTPSKGVVDNRTAWWVSATGDSAQRMSNDLPLYARTDDDQQEVPYIECTSCHNPHSSNPLFLRVNNSGSKLCLTCHDK